MITADFHMHTSFSTDSQSAPEEMIEAAISKGLNIICITDHHDKDYIHNGREEILDPEEYFAVLSPLRAKYCDQIDIRIGIEIGLRPHLGAYYAEFINKYPFDFVIGSVHAIGGNDLAEKTIFETHSDEEAYRIILREMLVDLKSTPDMDVLGHLDYMVRYGKSRAQEYSYQRFADEIDAVLTYIISSGIGIEMNMSGLKYGLGFTHPHPDIIRRYRELGGEIITVGADGHRPEHIAYDFSKAAGLLEACGFKYYTEFKERKPVFKSL